MQIADISLGSLHTPASKSGVCFLRPQDDLLLRNWVFCVASCHKISPPSPAPINIKDRKKCHVTCLFDYKEAEICA